MMMSDSICAAVTQASLLDDYYGFVCFFFRREFQNSSLLQTKCCLSIESSLRPFDVFSFKLEGREGGEVVVLTWCYLLYYLQQ